MTAAPFVSPGFSPAVIFEPQSPGRVKHVERGAGPGSFILLPFYFRVSGFAFCLSRGLFFPSSVKSPDRPPPHPHSLRKAKE
jgi:hypothetical protein